MKKLIQWFKNMNSLNSKCIRLEAEHDFLRKMLADARLVRPAIETFPYVKGMILPFQKEIKPPIDVEDLLKRIEKLEEGKNDNTD